MKKIVFYGLFLILLGWQVSAAERTGVLIDPGHSPKAPGVVSCDGIPEHEYNDYLAYVLASYLEGRNIPAGITRTFQEEKNLKLRTQDSGKYRLFLSLHHDSVQAQFMSQRSREGNCSEKAKGFSIFVSPKNRYYENSIQCAYALGTALREAGLMPSLHHAERVTGEYRKLLDSARGIYAWDDLIVLKTADAPALLLEAAVIVHPQEARDANSERFRDAVAEAVYKTLMKCDIVR